MNTGLHAVDIVIVVVYLVGCMVAGIWMRRYISHVDDFTVAGREVDVYLGIASLAATEMGLVTIMYTAQLGFEKGFAGADWSDLGDLPVPGRGDWIRYRSPPKGRGGDHPGTV